MTDTTAPKARNTKIREAILASLRDHPEETAMQVAARLNVDVLYVRPRVSTLKKQGLVKAVRREAAGGGKTADVLVVA